MSRMLKVGDMVGVVGCSNGLEEEQRGDLEELVGVLEGMGLVVWCGGSLFAREGVFSGSGEERGAVLNGMVQDDRVKAIFDITGGNVGNEVLSYVDFECLGENWKPFFGYSDLSVVVNSIYSQTGKEGFLYSGWNLVKKDGEVQREWFYRSLFCEEGDLFDVRWEFLRGECVEGVLIGGNIRCFMKLAGTRFMPDFEGKVLFLEALGGDAGLIASLLAQMKSMGVFGKVSGVLLGTFSYMDEHGGVPSVRALVLRATEDEGIPVAATRDVGHGSDSKCLVIGEYIKV